MGSRCAIHSLPFHQTYFITNYNIKTMLPKLKNQREITLTFNYNTKKVNYQFSANILKFSKDNDEKRRKECDLAIKMMCLALQNESAVFFRITIRKVLELMDKQNKKYFNKLEKQNKIKKLCCHK